MRERVPETTPPCVDFGILIGPNSKNGDGLIPEYLKAIIHAIARSVKSNNLRFFRVKCDILNFLCLLYLFSILEEMTLVN